MAMPHPFIPGAEIKAFAGQIDMKPRIRVPASTMRMARPQAAPDLAALAEKIRKLTAAIQAAA